MQQRLERTIIENVLPEIDGGIYHIKRTAGEWVNITADIFADGHDVIRAFVVYQHQNDKSETNLELDLTTNDTWEARFQVAKIGFYTYRIEAWVDALATWHKGFLKKLEDGQAMQVELLIGVDLLQKAAKDYSTAEARPMLDAAKRLANHQDEKTYQKALQYVVGDDFLAILKEHPYRKHVAVYDKNLRIRVERKKALFSAWYEFFPRSASSVKGQHGTLKDCIRLLPRVAELGFDVVYFPPIHPIGEVNRKGKNNAVTADEGDCGSPWAVGSRFGGHKAIAPELGSMQDYEQLIKTAREEYSIEIALDLAYQCSPDHPYVKQHPDWFTHRPDGTIAYAENPPKKYQDIVPLNFECADWKNLWAELKSVVVFWIEKGIKIFRVDNPHTKPIPFWQWLITEIHSDYPEVIFLSEAFTRPKVMASLAKVGFTQGYTYYTWRNTKAELTTYMKELTRTESREYFRPNFWANTPDILPYGLHERGSNAFYLRLALSGLLSSNYGVYGPAYEMMENESFRGKEEYQDSEKYEIKHYDWAKRNRLTDLMTELNKIRNENLALHTTWNIQFVTTNSDNLLSFIKISEDKTNIIWCVVNLDDQKTVSGIVEMPKDILGINGKINVKLKDLLTDEQYNWTKEWNFVELNPYKSPLHIFEVKIID